MGLKTVAFAVIVWLFVAVSMERVARAETVTLSYPASTLTFLAGKIAGEQGYFRDGRL